MHVLRRVYLLITNSVRRWLFPYLLRRARKLYPRIKGGSVERLTRSTVVKSGLPQDLLIEAATLQFVARNTSIRVPAVYDIWFGKDGKAYLIMEYLSGQMLRSVLRQLTEPQKAKVMSEMRVVVEKLRALPQPEPAGWIGSVLGGAYIDARISAGGVYGPFETERHYNDWRAEILLAEFGVLHAPTAEHIREIRREMPDDHRIVFTHGDLNSRNILVEVNGARPEDVTITGVVDWEQSGWRPEYCEADKVRYSEIRSGDWRSFTKYIGSNFEAELDREITIKLIHVGPFCHDLNEIVPSSTSFRPKAVGARLSNTEICKLIIANLT